jgi:hypothetical protein
MLLLWHLVSLVWDPIAVWNFFDGVGTWKVIIQAGGFNVGGQL